MAWTDASIRSEAVEKGDSGILITTCPEGHPTLWLMPGPINNFHCAGCQVNGTYREDGAIYHLSVVHPGV